ncbi:ragulator complex protein LAMTOR1-like isoform X2 [Tachypleus tridentatus]|uniref:ragulator complex protein LAMTOR1-like isoform X2 n=1 Tax=Tachypleus tridentatus TaxID=6853 RepID=UPI003FD3F3A7
MGCCFSCGDDDESSQHEDPNERTTLLSKPLEESSERTTLSNPLEKPSEEKTTLSNPTSGSTSLGPSEGYTRIPYVLSEKDKQILLDRLLQEVHEKMVNVTDTPYIPLGQKEFMDRARQYRREVASNVVDFTHPEKPPVFVDFETPEAGLSVAPIPQKDLKLLNEACDNVLMAVKEIKVEHREDLVVPYVAP